MGSGTLDDRYLHWLYSQVADVEVRKGSNTYWKLCKQLYTTEFTWFVPNDVNRAQDGIELRREWVEEDGEGVDIEWLALDCSFLEMLVALSRRLEFQSESRADYWFFRILDNLGFSDFNDHYRYSRNFVARRIKVVNERLYDQFGNGGLFPLPHSKNDQRKVEIWYQLSEYLLQDL